VIPVGHALKFLDRACHRLDSLVLLGDAQARCPSASCLALIWISLIEACTRFSIVRSSSRFPLSARCCRISSACCFWASASLALLVSRVARSSAASDSLAWSSAAAASHAFLLSAATSWERSAVNRFATWSGIRSTHPSACTGTNRTLHLVEVDIRQFPTPIMTTAGTGALAVIMPNTTVSPNSSNEPADGYRESTRSTNAPKMFRSKFAGAGYGCEAVNFQVTVLKVLVSYPNGFAAMANLKRDMAILVTSGPHWAERTKRLAARVPDLDIFSQGLVERTNGGWRVTDKGRAVLEIMEARPVQTQATELPPIRVVAEPNPAMTLSSRPLIAPVRRKRERKEHQRDVVRRRQASAS
jgi:hypothetical protein